MMSVGFVLSVERAEKNGGGGHFSVQSELDRFFCFCFVFA